MTEPPADLLFLTQRIPYPPTKGEKLRALQILRHLARTHRVHLGCLIDDPEDWQHVPAVQALCASTCFAALDRRRDARSHLQALASGRALSVALYDRAELRRYATRVLDETRPAVVFISSSNMAPYVLDHVLPGAHRGRRVVDLVDVDSEKWRAYADTARFPLSWLYRRETRLVRALERRIGGEADACTFVSTPEAALFRALVPDATATIAAVPNGVDFAYFDPDAAFPPPYDPARPNFVFTGTMDYAPNIDAVRWFVADILPRVRARLPDAQFHIVGANPAAAVRALASPCVHVTGRVPDVRPYLAHATAAVAPMRIARGIQNKVMEAMAMARATIVTADALEGIEATPGTELVLADTAEAIAEAALRLAADPAGAARIGAAARRRVVADFSWDGRLAGFDRLIATA